jgi:synaptojanin
MNYGQVPQPSSDEAAWWDGPGMTLANGSKTVLILVSGYPKGLVPMTEFLMLGDRKLAVNPFDSPEASSLSSSPSTSDEELYNDALGLQTPVTPQLRKPPPPPPRQPG